MHVLMQIIGDITRVTDVDAIVNAANETLEGGGGVDFSIHRAAGPALVTECKALPIKRLSRSTIVEYGRCDVGEAVITKGYQLMARHVIHTVAPLLSATGTPNDDALQRCYQSVLDCIVATESLYRIRSVAFCCIATGFYAFPMEQAARIALGNTTMYIQGAMYREINVDAHSCMIGTIRRWLESNSARVDRIVFVVWNDVEHAIYQQLWPSYFPSSSSSSSVAAAVPAAPPTASAPPSS